MVLPERLGSRRTVEALATADDDLPPVTLVNEMTLLAFGYRAPATLRAVLAGSRARRPGADPVRGVAAGRVTQR
ncbi:hypothetical protein [Nonomuraea dietziae]|uniref:hypothetical protein n=1 Tax=Nonomuraea dietziae TaxID=65515 RepID=UPI0034433AE1